MAREMEQIREAEHFLAFCVKKQEEFTKRDWLASLSLLTTRRQINFRSPDFQAYNNAVLDRQTLFEDNLHLVFHRYGVLGYAPALWRLSPMLKARLPTMKPRQIAVCAWALGRGLVTDNEVWNEIGRIVAITAEDFNAADLAMVSWGFAAIERRNPREITAMKGAVRSRLAEKGLRQASEHRDRVFTPHDLCMILRAFATLTPNDVSFAQRLLEAVKLGLEQKHFSLNAQALTTVWSVLADLNWKDPAFIEMLCEESRSLRLDHTLNQNMVVELALAIRKLEIYDARVFYQIIHFVDRRGLTCRANVVLTLAEVLADMGVTDEKAWKRLAVRAQQRAMQLDSKDLKRLKAAFIKSGAGNRRIFGMLQLFEEIRADEAQFGAQ